MTLRILTAFTSVLGCLVMLPPAAVADPLVSVIGSSSRTLDFPGRVEDPVEFFLPVALTEPGENETVEVQLIRLGRGDRELAVDPDWVRLATDGSRGTRGRLKFTIPADALRHAGSYTFTVEFWKKTVGKTEDGKPSTTLSDQGSLTATVSRPAGTLDLGAPIRIERVAFLPPEVERQGGSCLSSCLRPRDLVLTETGGLNGVAIGGADGQQAVSVRLRSDANSGEVTRLALTLPEEVAAGRSAKLRVVLSEPAPIGTVSGTLRFTSEQLQPREFTATVEVVTRLWRGWLVILIVVGILLGYLTRTMLEDRKLRARARAAALRVQGALDDAVERMADDDFRKRLDAARKSLAEVIRRRSAKEDELKTATEKASGELDAVVAEYEAARGALASEIATARGGLGDPSGLIRPLPAARAVAKLLDSLDAELNSGAVSAAKSRLESQLEPGLKALHDGIQLDAGQLKLNLDRGGAWPETGRDDVLSEAKTAVDAFVTAHAGRAVEAAALGQSVRELDLLLRRLQPNLADLRAADIAALADKVHDGLASIPRLKPLAEIGALEGAVTTFGETARTASGSNLFEPLMRAEKTMRDAIEAALLITSQTVQTPKPKPDGLDDGHFRKALNDVRQREGLNPLGAAPTAQGQPRRLDGPPDAAAGEMPAGLPELRIVAHSEVRVGARAVFSAELVTASGEIKVDTASWRVNGKPCPPDGGSALNCSYRPGSGERDLDVQVIVTVTGADGTRTIERSRRFLVLQRAGLERAEELEAEADRIGIVQTAVAGVLITLAGYSIFQASFVGSLADGLAALFWGFAVDITVAKAQEFGAPLQARKPSFAATE